MLCLPFSPLKKSERRSKIVWGEDNVSRLYLIDKGDVDGIWEKADYSWKASIRLAHRTAYIENNGMIAAFDAGQGITVWGSLQCPYYIHKALMALCNLPAEKSSASCKWRLEALRREGRISVDDRGALPRC